MAGRGQGGGAGPARAIGAEDAEADGELFFADITEVVITGLNDTASRLVVEWWTPDRGRQRVERD